MRARTALRRIHIWLGWLVGLPMLFWVMSGLLMVSRPIEQVRGEHLIRGPAAISGTVPLIPPVLAARPVRSLELQQGSDGPVWIIRYIDGGAGRADAATGRLLPSLTAVQAAEIVRSRYIGPGRIESVSRTSADAPPLELRRAISTWKVATSDHTHIYVDAATGEIAARRTSFWRLYDFMWGLHIMDLSTREDPSNPLVIGFGIAALLTVLLALALLPLSLRRRRDKSHEHKEVR